MDERVRHVAGVANAALYDKKAAREYVDGAPHIKHASLRKLYASLVVRVFDEARKTASVPRVLDLGAGEGSATLPFLELGARVKAVDQSESQLDALRARCARFEGMLDVECRDVVQMVEETKERYDIVVVSSFLHHIPDYLALIRSAIDVMRSQGQFLSFQDPLRYDSVNAASTAFCNLAYFAWRIFKGDVVGGLKRRRRRAKGIYLEDSVADNAEYHSTRNGVDQDAISALLTERGYRCQILKYFSTQSRLFQPIGAALGVKNTFAVVARLQKS